MLKDVRNFINGAVYGTTLIIPGVSATILAIMLGFYDELIHTINHFSEDYKKNIRYMALFLLGVAAGAVVFSSVVLFLLSGYSLPTLLFFMGLLAGMIPLVYSKSKEAAQKIAPREIIIAILFLLALIGLSQAVDMTTADPAEAIGAMTIALVLFVLLAGILNGATLVIPGLSGAFLLLIMGLYPLVIYSISLVGTYIGNPSDLSLLRDISFVLLPFAGGGVIGCIAMARLMEKLMRDYKKSVYAAILGLIIASIITLFLDPTLYQSGVTTISIIAGVVTFCAGCTAAYVLGKREDVHE